MRFHRLTRRGLARALVAGAGVALAGACSENAAIGRSQLILVDDAQLAALSKAAWADLKTKTPLSDNKTLNARLEGIGRAVADASGASDLDWEFVVFDSPEINAFVLPGGKVGFFRGLMDMTGDDAEIAAVMGHEAGHVTARHAAERVSQQLAVNAGVSLVSAVLAGSEEVGAFADEIGAALGAGLVYGVVLPYSRKHEYEADALGVKLMADAGFSPNAAVSFWGRMIAASAARAQPLEWLSTHPADEARLAALRVETAKLAGLPSRN
jgi:predicted Zn-dependent protease